MGDNNSTVIFNSSGPGGSQYYYDQSAKFNPTTAVVIISLIGGCFVLAFVSVVLRKCIRGDSGLTATQASATQQSGSYNMKSKGLAKTDVDALPLVHRADLDEKLDARECPVCLTDFEPEDPLRLLPSCKHVFHQECIDAWFDAHSTCPLCRASLLGGETETTKPQPVGGHGDHVETITEVSESGHNSDMETQLAPPNTLDAPLDTDSRMAARDESAFQTSESFKREPVQPSSTKNINSSFRKPSIRRSSSLSADLIALRNLLMRQNDQSGNVNSDAPSRRWFTRARSLDLARPRDRAEDSRDREEWVTIDLETGKAAQFPSSSSSSSISKGESSKAPERAWSDRWSLATLKGAVLTRSTSDVYSRSAHLPI